VFVFAVGGGFVAGAVVVFDVIVRWSLFRALFI